MNWSRRSSVMSNRLLDIFRKIYRSSNSSGSQLTLLFYYHINQIIGWLLLIHSCLSSILMLQLVKLLWVVQLGEVWRAIFLFWNVVYMEIQKYKYLKTCMQVQHFSPLDKIHYTYIYIYIEHHMQVKSQRIKMACEAEFKWWRLYDSSHAGFTGIKRFWCTAKRFTS